MNSNFAFTVHHLIVVVVIFCLKKLRPPDRLFALFAAAVSRSSSSIVRKWIDVCRSTGCHQLLMLWLSNIIRFVLHFGYCNAIPTTITTAAASRTSSGGSIFSLFTGRRQGLAAILSPQFNTNHTFNFAKNHIIGNTASSLIVGNNLLFFANFLLSQILNRLEECIYCWYRLKKATYGSEIFLT